MVLFDLLAFLDRQKILSEEEFKSMKEAFLQAEAMLKTAKKKFGVTDGA